MRAELTAMVDSDLLMRGAQEMEKVGLGVGVRRGRHRFETIRELEVRRTAHFV